MADAHGNLVALDAVLADIAGAGVDRIVCLGDMIQGGPQPAETVARLRDLGAPVVMGNADAFLLYGRRGNPNESISPEQLAMREWSLARLSDADRGFIACFTPTVAVDLPGGRGLLCFHGSPTSFDDLIFPETDRETVLALLGPYLPRYLTGGHTHLQQIRPLGEGCFFNPGSVGLPFQRHRIGENRIVSPWAEYAILTAADTGRISLDFRRVPYDVAAYARLTRSSGAPSAR